MELETTISVTLGGNDVELDVTAYFTVTGKYHPGTLTDPPEYPDVNINRVTAFFWNKQHEVPLDLLDEETLMDECYTAWEDSQQEDADAAYERMRDRDHDGAV